MGIREFALQALAEEERKSRMLEKEREITRKNKALQTANEKFGGTWGLVTSDREGRTGKIYQDGIPMTYDIKGNIISFWATAQCKSCDHILFYETVECPADLGRLIQRFEYAGTHRHFYSLPNHKVDAWDFTDPPKKYGDLSKPTDLVWCYCNPPIIIRTKRIL